MFLITTADRRFWKVDEEILFLGEWCKLFKDREVWSSIKHEVLPYHWDDREKFATDWQRLDAIYEKYLLLFTERLNAIHGVNYSCRYWRILIGIWLRAFVDALYDRYLSILSAEAGGQVTKTWICSTTPWAPENIPSFSFDDYNLYLYSRIIKSLGTIPYEEKDFSHRPRAGVAEGTKRKSFVSKVRGEILRHSRKGLGTVVSQGLATAIVQIYPRLLRNAPTKVVFVGSMYLPIWDLIKLQCSLRQVPFLYHGEKIEFEPVAPDWSMRSGLAFDAGIDRFERLLDELLPEQIPMAYVEHYKYAHERAIAVSPSFPKVVLTASSMNHRLCFEFWAAHHSERSGTKLLFSQHGGYYGTARYSSIEKHFLRISDRYYSWGSSMDGAANAKPMPSFRLRTAALALTSANSAGSIMWIATTMARYRMFAESDTAGPNMVRYMNEQARFLRELCAASRDLLLWRYFNDLWEERERWEESNPGLKVQRGRKKQLGQESDFLVQLKKCRMAVHTTNGTTYLEALAANFPSVVFWNPDDCATRESQRPCFEVLRAAGILHYSPESAADQVNAVYKNPAAWWTAPNVQRARKDFCHHLARTSDDWLGQWKDELASWSRESVQGLGGGSSVERDHGRG